MKHSAEFSAFDALVGKVLSVSHKEMQRREAEYKRQTVNTPRKRGRPPKVKASVSAPASNGLSR